MYDKIFPIRPTFFRTWHLNRFFEDGKLRVKSFKVSKIKFVPGVLET
jgi:hypothetical protein